MARTFQELVSDLFKAGATKEYDELLKAVTEKNRYFDENDLSQSLVRARVVSQMVVDCYGRVLSYVVNQLEIPAESIGIRTQDETAEFLKKLEIEAENVRARFAQKRNNMLANLAIRWQEKDEYDLNTLHLKARAVESVKLHVTATQSSAAKAQEQTWRKLHHVVDSQMNSRAHDIEEATRRDIYALGQRRPRPAPEAYDKKYVAGEWMKGMRKRIDLIFTLYPEIVEQLNLDVTGLFSLIRTHVNSLVDEAVIDYRRIVAEEFAKMGPEVPQEVVEKAVDAARSSVVLSTELMITALEKPLTAHEKKLLSEGYPVRGRVLKHIDAPKPEIRHELRGPDRKDRDAGHVVEVGKSATSGVKPEEVVSPKPDKPNRDWFLEHYKLVAGLLLCCLS